VSLYNQGVLNKGLESFEQLLLESGESVVACMLRRLCSLAQCDRVSLALKVRDCCGTTRRLYLDVLVA
jgi:hypothetical protein